VAHFIVNEVYMRGPDKMLIDSKSDGDHRGYWYDGKTITYYSYDENNYAAIKARPRSWKPSRRSTGTMASTSRRRFLLSTFTDDLIANSDRIVFLGKKNVEGRDCFHILAKFKTMDVQLWIADDSLNLPVRYSIADYDQKNGPRYEATFSDWQINPALPSAIFDFVPPPAAAPVKLVPQTIK